MKKTKARAMIIYTGKNINPELLIEMLSKVIPCIKEPLQIKTMDEMPLPEEKVKIELIFITQNSIL